MPFAISSAWSMITVAGSAPYRSLATIGWWRRDRRPVSQQPPATPYGGSDGEALA